jgi:regulator of sigma E protease
VITILSFLVVLMILVMAHEVGHLVAAKKQGITVREFAIGFGPRIGRITKGGTDYVIRLVPLGGYVHLGEESNEGAFRPNSPCYAERPPIDKILVAVAGPLANFILAIFVFALAALAGINSPAFLMNPPELGWVETGSPASRAGLRQGDIPIEVDGRRTTTWEEVMASLPLYQKEKILFKFTRKGTSGWTYLSGASRMNNGISPRENIVIDAVGKGSPAALAGIEPGDTITTVGGEPIVAWAQFLHIVSHSRNSLTITVARKGHPRVFLVKPIIDKASQKALVGISYNPEQISRRYSFLAALGRGYSMTRRTVSDAVGTMWALLTGSVSVKALGGPVAIAQASGNVAKTGIVPLLTFLAFMSVQLGVFNLLPFIPIVDGGQITLFIFELIRRRPLTSVSLEHVAKAGWAAMAVLILFVTYNDVVRLL